MKVFLVTVKRMTSNSAALFNLVQFFKVFSSKKCIDIPKPLHLVKLDLSRQNHTFNDFFLTNFLYKLPFFLYHSFINPHKLLYLEQYQSAGSKMFIQNFIYELTGNKVF